jgi:hypothetical protein
MSVRLRRLRDRLATVDPGTIADDNIQGEIEYLLGDAWDELAADYGGMKPSKLRSRTEAMIWQPPVLSFKIERHGGTVNGSTRAEIQTWEVHLEAGTARFANSGFRQLHPMAKPVKTAPIADSLVDSVVNRREDRRIQWTLDRRRFRVLTSAIWPSSPNRTLQGRSRRLRQDMEARLLPLGYTRRDAWWSTPRGER